MAIMHSVKKVVTFKKIRAPAKINVCLKITGRRSDGYHNLWSVMVPVSLFDDLEITARSGGIHVSAPGLDLKNQEENLVYRAARDFFLHTDINPGISIKLSKNIPISAGLGGGSSDAASTLLALNDMWSRPLNKEGLEVLAFALGADVPFFLKGKPCLAQGIGERLEPIENWPNFWYVIVSPPILVSTSWVYRNLNLKLTNKSQNSRITVFEQCFSCLDEILENDLETVTVPRYPVIAQIKEALLEAGARGSLMTGSGPAVFGVFDSFEEADKARKEIECRKMGAVFAVSSL
jgi:4-diphosphocytidyl-2-C-methyl-D-erythritol kinase